MLAEISIQYTIHTNSEVAASQEVAYRMLDEIAIILIFHFIHTKVLPGDLLHQDRRNHHRNVGIWIPCILSNFCPVIAVKKFIVSFFYFVSLYWFDYECSLVNAFFPLNSHFVAMVGRKFIMLVALVSNSIATVAKHSILTWIDVLDVAATVVVLRHIPSDLVVLVCVEFNLGMDRHSCHHVWW